MRDEMREERGERRDEKGEMRESRLGVVNAAQLAADLCDVCR